MSARDDWTRRRFLLTSGATIALPFLESLYPARAVAQALDPKRFVAMYMPNGTYNIDNDGAFWQPRQSGVLVRDQLPAVFQPFVANFGDFSTVRGVYNERLPADHGGSISCFLVGSGYQAMDRCALANESLDQAMAPKLGNKPTLCINVGNLSSPADEGFQYPYHEHVSYRRVNGEMRGVDNYRNPVSLFKDMFANLTGTGEKQVQATLARNKSILDNALESIKSLNARLGSKDRDKLDDYLTNLRFMEKAQRQPASGASCQPIGAPPDELDSTDDFGNFTDYPERMEIFLQMVALAFKCDMIRCVTIMFDGEARGRVFRERVPRELFYNGVSPGGYDSHIGISHRDNGQNAQAIDMNVTRDRFYVSFVMKLVNLLKDTTATDPSGSRILDNTIIFAGHGINQGTHGGFSGRVGNPLLLAGGRNLMKQAQAYDFNDTPIRDLLYTINRRLGAGLESFSGSTRDIGI